MALVDYIGNRPAEFVGDPNSKTFERDVINYQRSLSSYNTLVQAAQNEQAQEATTKSAMQKAAHDVVMEIARRFV